MMCKPYTFVVNVYFCSDQNLRLVTFCKENSKSEIGMTKIQNKKLLHVTHTALVIVLIQKKRIYRFQTITLHIMEHGTTHLLDQAQPLVSLDELDPTKRINKLKEKEKSVSIQNFHLSIHGFGFYGRAHIPYPVVCEHIEMDFLKSKAKKKCV